MRGTTRTDLFREREEELEHELNDLQWDDVQEDDAFERTKEAIKSRILLEEVDISYDGPELKDHEATTEERGGHQFPAQTFYIEFPFSGSPELFAYMPEGATIPGTRIYQPDPDEDVVPIEVTQENEPSRDKVLEEAKSHIKPTIALLNKANEQVREWNRTMEERIDQRAEAKREQLRELYG